MSEHKIRVSLSHIRVYPPSSPFAIGVHTDDINYGRKDFDVRRERLSVNSKVVDPAEAAAFVQSCWRPVADLVLDRDEHYAVISADLGYSDSV